MADVTQYFEAVVPAGRLAEVASVIGQYFTVPDLLSMDDEDMMKIAFALKTTLTFEGRFLCRYLKSAQQMHGMCERMIQGAFFVLFLMDCKIGIGFQGLFPSLSLLLLRNFTP